MKQYRKPRAALRLLCLALLAAALLFSLTSCMMSEEEQAQNHALATAFLDYAMDGDTEAAYSMVMNVCTRTEFLSVWEPVCAALEGAEGYELKVTGMNTQTDSEGKIATVTYEGTADNGSLFYLRLSTHSEMEGIAGLGFNDATAFVASTSYVRFVDIALLLLSAVFFAFEIWMLVDCIRRPIPRKVLWILLILISLGVTVSIGAESFSLKLAGLLLFPLSRMQALTSSATVSLQVLLPWGAIAYFFLRRRLSGEAATPTAPPSEASENAEAENVDTPSK